MNVHNMLTHEPPLQRRRSDHLNGDAQQEAQKAHQYPTRHATQTTQLVQDTQRFTTPQTSPPFLPPPHSECDGYGHSPSKADPKNVTFVLIFDGDMRNRGRLPMKVQIFPHDNTDGIVSTVKNFFGIYDDAFSGVAFEDSHEHTLIASYDNFTNGMTIYVRAFPHCLSRSWQEPDAQRLQNGVYEKPEQQPHLEEGFRMPSQVSYQPQHPSRPSSGAARRQSTSPILNNGQRNLPAPKIRSRTSLKRESRESSFQQQLDNLNSESFKENPCSDGDAASVSSSFRARNEHLASAEISEANIVEGGRRQKAKFESSELPLYQPPQVCAPHSASSISPQRRSTGNDIASPMANIHNNGFVWNKPLPSPQNNLYITNGYANITAKISTPAHGHRLRDRVNNPTISAPFGRGNLPRTSSFGILPTPDPTIASTISDEDVALQLMRLGDPNNMSHGRTSASTMDDAFSGRADAASSAASDGEDESSGRSDLQMSYDTSTLHHKRPLHQVDARASEDEERQYKRPKLTMPKTNSASSRTTIPTKKPTKPSKSRSVGQSKKSKVASATNIPKVPISPASLPPQSRKGSSASLMGPPQLPYPDDQDLSTKPRCQRCRKSKKGCDRQRPCQRCKDAGISIEGCISEDEGNGRKGRFGRHMGVSVNQDTLDVHPSIENEAGLVYASDALSETDKSKKRKR